MYRATAEARLIDAGWTPPTEDLRAAIDRREAFRAAMSALRIRGQAEGQSVAAALTGADRDGIVTAIVATAIGEYLDRGCQRPDTELTAWSATLETAMRDAIWAAAQSVLGSLEGFASDTAYLRSEAEQAMSIGRVVGYNGQPTPVRAGALSLNAVMVPR